MKIARCCRQNKCAIINEASGERAMHHVLELDRLCSKAGSGLFFTTRRGEADAAGHLYYPDGKPTTN